MTRSRPMTFLAGAVMIPVAALAVAAWGGGGAASAATPKPSGGRVAESSLIHRLKTCLPAKRTRPTVVLVHGAWADASSWSGDQIITAQSELAMALRAHSRITLPHGGSHLTLISHPNAVTAVMASAICSLH